MRTQAIFERRGATANVSEEEPTPESIEAAPVGRLNHRLRRLHGIKGKLQPKVTEKQPEASRETSLGLTTKVIKSKGPPEEMKKPVLRQ